MIREVLCCFFLLWGTFFICTSAIGMLRFPDLYCRMHALSKAGTMGFIGILLSTVFYFQSEAVLLRAFIAIFFLFLTIPVSTHLLARSAYKIRVQVSDKMRRDELKEHVGFQKQVGME